MSRKNRKGPKPTKIKINPQIPLSKVSFKHQDLSEIFIHGREYPIYGCWVMDGWQDKGMAPVIIVRQLPDGKVFLASYLIDFLCLGVKNAFTMPPQSVQAFQKKLPKLCAMSPLQISVELAHEMVYGALEYAEKYGLKPHKDFYALHADTMLDAPDAHPRTHNVEFGKNGKPMYVPGPYDSPMRIREVTATLNRTAGEDNYNIIIPIDSFIDLDE